LQTFDQRSESGIFVIEGLDNHKDSTEILDSEAKLKRREENNNKFVCLRKSMTNMHGNKKLLIVLVTDVADSINIHFSQEEKQVENDRSLMINAELEKHLFLLNKSIVSL